MAEQNDDAESSRSGSAAPEPKGKQSSSQLRKAQNRLAQREFRQRKQIRDLEARVEVLSQGEDERAGLGLLLVKNLLKENKELRQLLKAMAGFIGEGAGSFLPRLGLSAEQLDAILNRADTDTAHEAFLQLKVPKEVEEANPGLPIGEIRKPAGQGKRKRGSLGLDDVEAESPARGGPSRQQAGAGSGAESATAAGATGLTGTPATAIVGATPDEPRDAFDNYDLFFSQAAGSPSYPSPNAAALSGFGLTVPAATPRPPSPLAGTPLSPLAHAHAYDPQQTEQQRSSLRAAVAQLTALHAPAAVDEPMSPAQLAERQDVQDQLLRNLQGAGATERKTEAMQLVSYHLNKWVCTPAPHAHGSFRINHEYRLPPSLRPTAVQRTVPHEHAIDGVVFPSIRNRMILLRGRYDLVEAFQRYIDDVSRRRGRADPSLQSMGTTRSTTTTGRCRSGGSAISSGSPPRLPCCRVDGRMLVDDEVYTITNKWRTLRGLPALVPPSINFQDTDPHASLL
ncbi:hypothetical protein Q5752_005601 [Cryptotrichosporon argae]